MVIINRSKLVNGNYLECDSSSLRDCRIEKGDILRLYVIGRNSRVYSYSVLVENYDGTISSSISAQQNSNYFDIQLSYNPNLRRVTLTGYVSNNLIQNVTNSNCRVSFDLMPGSCTSMQINLGDRSILVNLNTSNNVLSVDQIPWGGNIKFNSSGSQNYLVNTYWMRPYIEDPNDPVNR